jgi:hypothetical protein
VIGILTKSAPVTAHQLRVVLSRPTHLATDAKIVIDVHAVKLRISVYCPLASSSRAPATWLN